MNRRIIFMGTPEFAVATLDALVKAGMEVVAVVTAPDKPAGRGQQLRSSAVKLRALELGLPVLQPEKLKDPNFLGTLDRFDASLYIVVAFRMLPAVVWQRPRLGTVNLHGSLLPAYRGAAPINWAIINGEKITGVTTFKIQQTIDTGDILLQEKIPIGADETAGELHDRMMVIGAELMVRTVEGLFDNALQPRPQDLNASVDPPLAPKINSGTCRIDLMQPSGKVHDLIRGMSPYPGAWLRLSMGSGEINFKVLRSHITPSMRKPSAGVISVDGEHLLLGCADGWVEAIDVQPEGKRRMAAAEFLRGMRSMGELQVIRG